jgi:glycosyltransferase involved in cell wall biosynthesis
VIVDTPYVREEIAHRDNLSVIPQGIFGAEFAQMHTHRRGIPLVASIGVFSPRKGHHLTIEAFAEVVKRLPEARLVIAGSVTDAAYHRRLQQLIIRHELSEHVELAPDPPRPELIALLTRARIFALHSEEESQGIALCEALAAGLPVIATKTGGIPYVVGDCKEGILVAYGDIKKFAAAILFLLTEQEAYRTMSANARTAGSRFDWKHVSDDMAKLYRAL